MYLTIQRIVKVPKFYLTCKLKPRNIFRLGKWHKFTLYIKHTNFNRCLDLYKNQKLNQKNPERRSLYKPKMSHFLHFRRKVAIVRIGSKKPFSGETLLVTIDP